MSFKTFQDLDRRHPIFGLKPEQMRDAGMLGGGASQASDFAEESLVFMPYELNNEYGDQNEIDPLEVERAISSAVIKDIEIHELSYLLEPQNAFDLALDAYNTYASDATLDVPHSAALYLHGLSERLPAVVDREKFHKEIELFLSELDKEYQKYLATLAESDSPLVAA